MKLAKEIRAVSMSMKWLADDVERGLFTQGLIEEELEAARAKLDALAKRLRKRGGLR